MRCRLHVRQAKDARAENLQSRGLCVLARRGRLKNNRGHFGRVGWAFGGRKTGTTGSAVWGGLRGIYNGRGGPGRLVPSLDGIDIFSTERERGRRSRWSCTTIRPQSAPWCCRTPSVNSPDAGRCGRRGGLNSRTGRGWEGSGSYIN
jgi:hypothetical protein